MDPRLVTGWWNKLSVGSASGSGLSSIAKELADAPWKTAEDLVAKPPPPDRDISPVHEPAYASTIPVGFGLTSFKGQLLWADGPARKTVNGKLGWFASVFVGHSWNVFQRPGQCLRVKAGDGKIFDARTGALPILMPFTVDASEHEDGGTVNKIAAPTIRFYDGIDNDFDPTVVAVDGAANVGAFNGIRGIFIEDLDLEPYGDRIPVFDITWTDEAAAAATSGTLPLLATTALGYSQNANSLLAYDRVLHRFTVWYEKSGDALGIHLGVIDFASGSEITLNPVSGKPDADIDNIHAACPLPGSGLILCEGNDAALDNWDLLIESETGQVLASRSNGGAEEVNWNAALPLPGTGTRYIATGAVDASATTANLMRAWALIDVDAPSIAYLQYKTDQIGNGTSGFVTPGFSDTRGVVFFLAFGGAGGTVYQVRFVDATDPIYTALYTAGGSEQITGLYYDAGTHALAVSILDGGRLVRAIDASSGSEIGEAAIVGNAAAGDAVVPGGGSGDTLTHRLLPGFAVMRHSSTQTVSLLDMTGMRLFDVGKVASLGPEHYDQMTGTLYAAAADQWQFTATLRYDAGDVTVQGILTAFCTYDGGGSQEPLLTPSQLAFDLNNLDAITGGLKGVGLDRETDLRDLVLNVCAPFDVDRVDTPTGVKFRRRTLNDLFAADLTLGEADLVEQPGGRLLSSRRAGEAALPRELVLEYRSNESEYNIVPAKASLPTGVFAVTSSQLKRTLSPPLFMTDAAAGVWAMRALQRWIEAQVAHEGALRPKHLKAEPGDAVDLTVGGVNYVAKLTRVTKRPDHAQEFRAENFLTSQETDMPAPDITVPATVERNANTRHVFIDGPLLAYGHDRGGDALAQYHVMTGPDSWTGGVLYRKRAGETVWAKVAELAGVTPVVGVLAAALPAPPVSFETDAVNSLTIRLLAGDAAAIAAQTEADYYAAARWALVGAPGRWLALTWRNRTVNADGTITLDTLFQGLRGTEPHQGTSQAGDLFVLVRDGEWVRADHDLADLDQKVRFKAVAHGQDPAAVPGRRFTVSGAAETPRAPGDLDAAISGSDIVLTAARRSRLYVGTAGGSSGGLGSDLDVYRFTIYDGPGGAVLRQYSDVAGASKTYPSADITADFGAIPNNLTFGVEQKSSIAGIGYGHLAARSVALQ